MQIQEYVPLAKYTTFKAGGSARYYCRPENSADVQEAVLYANEHSLEIFRMGGGSNVLVSDKGFEGLVIHMAGLKTFRFEDTRLITGPGIAVDKLANLAAGQGLAGLAFAGGLPGSIGGAVYMNARAYGASFSDVVSAVEIVDEQGKSKTLPAGELDYKYKYSKLMDSHDTIVSITLQLISGDRDNITRATKENHDKRVQMGQFYFPNAGCVFKNDYSVGIPTGKIIDELGLLSHSVGDACIFENHGNFIVNKGKATASDIRKLIDYIKKTVLEKKSIQLEEEIRYLGSWE